MGDRKQLLLAIAFGFSAALANPFTIGVAQGLAGRGKLFKMV